ncbi:Uncharacterized protein dnm_005250 [Desulfonema magnum]|uniref:Uncharacterized protein n=1 Tax=Desulfonema magnum TaxID=45655 RepID=A0A975BF17_9BACT|nr:Uncharacterized protein dnm_005250 [Desulfonema magnum]
MKAASLSDNKQQTITLTGILPSTPFFKSVPPFARLGLTNPSRQFCQSGGSAEARKLMLKGKKSLLNQANEISRRKSKCADHH